MSHRNIDVPEKDSETLRLEILLQRTKVPIGLPDPGDETTESVLAKLKKTTDTAEFTRLTQTLTAILVAE